MRAKRRGRNGMCMGCSRDDLAPHNPHPARLRRVALSSRGREFPWRVSLRRMPTCDAWNPPPPCGEGVDESHRHCERSEVIQRPHVGHGLPRRPWLLAMTRQGLLAKLGPLSCRNLSLVIARSAATRQSILRWRDRLKSFVGARRWIAASPSAPRNDEQACHDPHPARLRRVALPSRGRGIPCGAREHDSQ
ncbi:MAG: hypothetical protein JWN07_1037 [Hyphomicrobiales bacterium]|nr:hypothetical protein [Hyphomicrobiales bacterium]